MRAISLWNPWSSAWLSPLKTYETRHWPTTYRGPLLVHAAKKKDGDVKYAFEDEDICADLMSVDIVGMHYGAIIGQVELVDCQPMVRLPEPSDRERRWGNWSPERFAWERGPNYTVFAEPIPYRGQQGFFDVPDSVLRGGV